MPFQAATMTWTAKETTITHLDYSLCGKLPWRVYSVVCTAHGASHQVGSADWKINGLNTLPDQSGMPTSMTATLKVVPSAGNLATIQQHFTENRVVTVTIMCGTTSQTLSLTLSSS